MGDEFVERVQWRGFLIRRVDALVSALDGVPGAGEDYAGWVSGWIRARADGVFVGIFHRTCFVSHSRARHTSERTRQSLLRNEFGTGKIRRRRQEERRRGPPSRTWPFARSS